MTQLLQLAQDKPLVKHFRFRICLVVLENTNLEQMIKNGCTSFCIFETNPFILKHFIQNIVIGSHLHSTDEVLIIRRKNYLTFESWFLFIRVGGSMTPGHIIDRPGVAGAVLQTAS